MRKCRKGDYVVIIADEEYKYGHRIPLGTISKVIHVSPYSSSVFPYITQHSMRELRDSEIYKITRIRNGEQMWTEKDFTIHSFPTLEDFRAEFELQITPLRISEFGLIDKSGNFYQCDYGGHQSLASVLCDYSRDDAMRERFSAQSKDPLDFLIEDEKWISICHKGYERKPTISCYNNLTKHQENVVYDYITRFNLTKFPDVVRIKS